MTKYQLRNPVTAIRFDGDLAPIARAVDGKAEMKIKAGGYVWIAVPAFDAMTHREFWLAVGSWLVIGDLDGVSVFPDQAFENYFVAADQ